LREEEINRLKRKVGELTMDLDILQVAVARQRPTPPETSVTATLPGVSMHRPSLSNAVLDGRATFRGALGQES